MATVESLFLEISAAKLLEFLTRIEACLAKLTDDQIWARGHETENAVGNLVLHLGGNVRQWVIGALGGQPDRRDRAGEFSARGGRQAGELAAGIRGTVEQALTVIRGVHTDQLTAVYEIQGYSVSGVEVVYHVVEHFAQHTGQIIFATKMLVEEDMGFYRHLSHQTYTERAP
ncbi:MAG TPA: DUF1572 family protein [Bryobacteraceae bacterium]|jgi:uncharacterized damage-inducible protein DinB|nr:DUF1572 family protein [Bryobacteraceae bacterium]